MIKSSTATATVAEMKVKSSIACPKIDCKVCGVETTRKIRCGALVCDACKRFYLRYRSFRTALRCKNGSSRCLAESESQVELTQKGVVWRHMCTSCRFDKCIRVGMGRNSPYLTGSSTGSEPCQSEMDLNDIPGTPQNQCINLKETAQKQKGQLTPEELYHLLHLYEALAQQQPRNQQEQVQKQFHMDVLALCLIDQYHKNAVENAASH